MSLFKRFITSSLLLFLLLFVDPKTTVNGFVSNDAASTSRQQRQQKHKQEQEQQHPLRIVSSTQQQQHQHQRGRQSSFFCVCVLKAIKIDGYDDAFDIIDECSMNGKSNDKLYDAVRFIDKNGYKIYPTITHKEELLYNSTLGSWKLQLATGGGKYTTFKPVPIFAFARIDTINFGNGVGFNQDNIFLSLLGRHIFVPQKRQMIITIDDAYIPGGNSITKILPNFIKDGVMGIGKQPEDFESSRPPTFTFIGASNSSLIARGGTGGIAIWTRLSKDIRVAAYGEIE